MMSMEDIIDREEWRRREVRCGKIDDWNSPRGVPKGVYCTWFSSRGFSFFCELV